MDQICLGLGLYSPSSSLSKACSRLLGILPLITETPFCLLVFQSIVDSASVPLLAGNSWMAIYAPLSQRWTGLDLASGGLARPLCSILWKLCEHIARRCGFFAYFEVIDTGFFSRHSTLALIKGCRILVHKGSQLQSLMDSTSTNSFTVMVTKEAIVQSER